MIVLGSTGSIGVNALAIAQQFNLPIEGLCAGKNVALLNAQIARFSPKFVVIGDPALAEKVNHPDVWSGEAGITRMLEAASSEVIVNALVGFLGLKPTLLAQKLGKRVALANKESLVVAGAFLDTKAITPIDSEHFGLWYLLSHRPMKRMCITASGGAFRDTPLDKLASMTPKDALKHPNWAMGPKITIDSATMVNKLFELLEARWLFTCNAYDALIETKSIIHALIDFEDGSTTAHLAGADMQLPIAFALMGEVARPILPSVDLLAVGSLEFRPIDVARYPIWELKEALLASPEKGVIVNAANEAMMTHFWEEKCSIVGLAEGILRAYRQFEDSVPKSIDEVFLIDKEVRDFCKNLS
jgi:1-deoxy-D-xylulose-5-phosphate reductoisomerase